MDALRRIALAGCQYWKGGEPLREEFRELGEWARRTGVAPEPGEWLVIGRLCGDVSVGDPLFTGTGGEVLVRRLWAYGRSLRRLDAGMTCGMLVTTGETTLPKGDELYFL